MLMRNNAHAKAQRRKDMWKVMALAGVLFAVLFTMAAVVPMTELKVFNSTKTASTSITQDGTRLAVSTGAAFSGALTASGAGTIGAGLTVDTSTLVVDAVNNRVGIGTATPARPLEIDSNTQYPYIYLYGAYTPTGSSNKGVSITMGDVGAAERAKMGIFDNSSYAGGAGTNFFISSRGGINFRVGSASVNNSTGMSIDSSGNTTMGGTYVTLPGGCRDWGMRSSAPASPTPAEGDRYYNTTSDALFLHNGSAWERVTRGASYAQTGVAATSEIYIGAMNVNLTAYSAVTLDQDATHEVIDTSTAIDGQVLTLVNIGSYAITLPCYAAGTTYSKVVAQGGGASIVLAGSAYAHDGATFRYVASLGRWVQIG